MKVGFTARLLNETTCIQKLAKCVQSYNIFKIVFNYFFLKKKMFGHHQYNLTK